jgi:hypothetical protein
MERDYSRQLTPHHDHKQIWQKRDPNDKVPNKGYATITIWKETIQDNLLPIMIISKYDKSMTQMTGLNAFDF